MMALWLILQIIRIPLIIQSASQIYQLSMTARRYVCFKGEMLISWNSASAFAKFAALSFIGWNIDEFLFIHQRIAGLPKALFSRAVGLKYNVSYIPQMCVCIQTLLLYFVYRLFYLGWWQQDDIFQYSGWQHWQSKSVRTLVNILSYSVKEQSVVPAWIRMRFCIHYCMIDFCDKCIYQFWK